MSKLIKYVGFNITVKQKLHMKVASLLFSTVYFLLIFDSVFYDKKSWQRTQSNKKHPVQQLHRCSPLSKSRFQIPHITPYRTFICVLCGFVQTSTLVCNATLHVDQHYRYCWSLGSKVWKRESSVNDLKKNYEGRRFGDDSQGFGMDFLNYGK